jgi:predicted enzyme related to lactoylglutathione lyase
MAQRGGCSVAGLRPLDDAMKSSGVPAHVLTYFFVEDANASATDAMRLGATVVAGPMEIPMAGTMAVIQDPLGAVFALWESYRMRGAHLVNEPGAVVWNELLTRDPVRSRDFYGTLFGWEFAEKDFGGVVYTSYSVDGRERGGLLPISPEMGGMPTIWNSIFAVDDTDAVVGTAVEMGAHVMMPPTDTPFGHMAQLAGPGNIAFGVLRPRRGPDGAADLGAAFAT